MTLTYPLWLEPAYLLVIGFTFIAGMSVGYALKHKD